MVTAPLPNRTPGAALLGAFLEGRRQTQEAFGAVVGVSGVTVHRWVKGKARPTFATARLIERSTGGTVPAVTFFPELIDQQEAA
jgi:transcriptional regulator with XRE-family HTH domain